MLHYTVNQRPHWACRQYGHYEGTPGWLGVELKNRVKNIKAAKYNGAGTVIVY